MVTDELAQYEKNLARIEGRLYSTKSRYVY